MKTDTDLLERGLEALGILSEPLRGRLVKYIEEIELWNPTYSLVNASGNELVIRHILDSLAPLSLLKTMLSSLDTWDTSVQTGKTANLADIGTGAGLPGIPLALALPDRNVFLVERMGKRVMFLENQKVILGLHNVTILESEAERANGPFDLVVFRAFRPFTETRLFRSIASHVSPGGIIAAYKGKHATAKEELDAISDDARLGDFARSAEIIALNVPFLEEERCLVVMKNRVPD
ncbi:MAG: 16S rRNA (guanine(527)-N(7))-methyltransferase RsmG [Rectinemataceae bacterium]|nr:16S rRNA (guanine(527)-N(7))-methyltransferase RsmG [Rectinemataceae bacterium]